MKLLLDECVDRRWRRDLVGHDVRTVPEMGWSGLSNGKLLKAAAGVFDVLITTDRTMRYQQSITNHEIALLVVRAKPNKYAGLTQLSSRVLQLLPMSQPRTVTVIDSET